MVQVARTNAPKSLDLPGAPRMSRKQEIARSHAVSCHLHIEHEPMASELTSHIFPLLTCSYSERSSVCTCKLHGPKKLGIVNGS